MLPLAVGVSSTFTLIDYIVRNQKQASARQQMAQIYIDRLLLAKTPEERQPILDEMSEQQVLKGIRLHSSDLEDLDLSFADFSGADLSGATLAGADLTGANLSGAILSYATLTYVTLRGANLKNAHLRGVNLRGADLREADFSGAFMRGAVLVDAALNEAVLEGAQLHGANMQDADLRGAQLANVILQRANLPDGQQWQAETDLGRFTSPFHPNFWRANSLYYQKTSSMSNSQPSRGGDNNDD